MGAGPGPSRLADDDLALMLLIRHFEQAVLDLFGQGKLHGTTHTCLGQEYIPVALASLLDDRDYVFSNHRGHGHYLARFEDPYGLLAEVMGREGSVCCGVGGSQHLFRGRYLSTGVQGQSVPVAAGAALHLKRHEPGRVAVVHVGDGTWGEGAVYEALNMASLWSLPLVVIVENNGIAQSTPATCHTAGTIAGRVAAFGVGYWGTGSCDISQLRAGLAPLLDQVRRTSRPLVAEFVTSRLGPHSKGDDTRTAAELDRIREADWYPRYAAAFPVQFDPLDSKLQALIASVVREVDARPRSVWNTGPSRRP
jgi:acetoin:2,6-dichlorophenolindophenol oxidoreductase subunit alpha